MSAENEKVKEMLGESLYRSYLNKVYKVQEAYHSYVGESFIPVLSGQELISLSSLNSLIRLCSKTLCSRKDYNRGAAMEDYFCFGQHSFRQMLWVKKLRISSLLGSLKDNVAHLKGGTNRITQSCFFRYTEIFKSLYSLQDSISDAINYSRFCIAHLEGKDGGLEEEVSKMNLFKTLNFLNLPEDTLYLRVSPTSSAVSFDPIQGLSEYKNPTSWRLNEYLQATTDKGQLKKIDSLKLLRMVEEDLSLMLWLWGALEKVILELINFDVEWILLKENCVSLVEMAMKIHFPYGAKLREWVSRVVSGVQKVKNEPLAEEAVKSLENLAEDTKYVKVSDIRERGRKIASVSTTEKAPNPSKKPEEAKGKEKPTKKSKGPSGTKKENKTQTVVSPLKKPTVKKAEKSKAPVDGSTSPKKRGRPKKVDTQ